MWVFTVVATISGLGGLGLSLRNYWLLRYKPIHERQAKLQEGLKKTLAMMNEHHFSKAVNQLRANQMPSQQKKEQLENLIELLSPQVNDYIAPTPPQIAAYLATVRAAVDEWENVLTPPGSDQIFVDGDAEGRRGYWPGSRTFRMTRRPSWMASESSRRIPLALASNNGCSVR
jgi:hypothetical protein